MLRVGLTGGLGSGKSTAAAMFAALGAHVLQSDAIGRDLMEPGQPVHASIVQHFGPSVLQPDGRLDRSALARIAFADGRVEELNAIVHPAVIARQAEMAQAVFQQDPNAVVIVESALIFETNYSDTNHSERNPDNSSQQEARSRWHTRFDRIILVTAPEDIKVARFVARSAAHTPLTPQRQQELEAEAHRRLAQQLSDEQKSVLSDYVLTNNGALIELEWQVDQLWPILQSASHSFGKPSN
jgi:dephospho-CoA kinase